MDTTDYSQKNWKLHDRAMWEKVCEKDGILQTLKLYLYQYTNDAELSILFVENLVRLKSIEWVQSRDLGYLLDKCDLALAK